MDHETFPKNSHETHVPGQPGEPAPTLRQAQGERDVESPATDAYGRTPDRWAGSGDPDDPTAGLSDREYDIYWAGVRDSIARYGVRAAASALPAPGATSCDSPGHSLSDLPCDPRYDPDADPDAALLRPWLKQFDAGLRDAADAEACSESHWNPRRKRVFLATLAASGIVTDACRAASISPRSAYNLRNRDAIFAEAWVAAQALARQRLADDLLERALRGQVERIVRKGEVIAERHRSDNRLALGLLTRLDRLAAPDLRDARGRLRGEPGAHKVLMAHWDDFLDTIDPTPIPPPSGGVEDDPQDQRDHPKDGGGAPLESGEASDYDSDVEGHTPVHTREPVAGRCELRELVRTLKASRRSAPARAAAPAAPAESEDEEHEIWQDSQGRWWTDLPPPEDFDGVEEGRYGGWDYRRDLDEDERFAVEQDDDEDRAERARLEALRRAAFGLPPEDEDDEDDEDEDNGDEDDDGTQIPPRTGGVADDRSDQRDREAVEGHVTPWADIAKPGDSADTASHQPPPPIADGPEPAAAQRLGDP
ncbi:MAG: hypothetical protein GW859_09060 [Sphingomonadales bacterium]|nr:hypothetical protein [Sphingomonadales bacterium]